MRYYALAVLWFALGTLGGCRKSNVFGTLTVVAAGSGTFEIYRIASEAPLQLVSEQVGQLNQPTPLIPGSYLVLADCSSASVIIYPETERTLVAHRIEFVPPHPPTKQDGFSVQCHRSDQTRSRQLIANRYELNVLHGKSDILVGMVPLHVDFDTAVKDPKQPTSLSFPLTAVQIANASPMQEEQSYFLSPVNELTSVTKPQLFGHWEFLLPGQYVLEVNGTKMEVTLKAGEERIVRPAQLLVTTSSEVDLNQAVRIKGDPWLVEINGDHWLNFNETYPVLPGKAYVGINGSTQSVEVTLTEGETSELKAHSVLIDLGCAHDDTACLGGKDVSLYRQDEPYPFLESISDIPIIFIDEGKPIMVGVEGSRDITYQLASKDRDRKLTLGYAQIIPQPTHRTAQLTDLVRINTTGEPFASHTLDLNLEKPNLVPLIAGRYQLEHFFSHTSVEGDRRTLQQNLLIEPGKTTSVEVPVYFSEKRFAAYKRKLDKG